MYTMEDLKTNRDAQITVFSIVFFLIAFPSYFAYASSNATGELGGGVGDYQVNGEISYVPLASGSQYVNDGETWEESYFTDTINNADDLNIVGVRFSLTYNEDEANGGINCAGVQDAADTISASMGHEEHSASADGQNTGGSGAHEIVVEWYNSSLLTGVISDLSMKEIADQLEMGEAGLGQYDASISVSANAGGRIGCFKSDDGEEVQYVVELMVLDYTIVPYIDVNDV